MIATLLALLLSPGVQTGVEFERAERVDAGAPSVAFTDAADLNGDGLPDLVLRVDTSVGSGATFRRGSRFALAMATAPGEWSGVDELAFIELEGLALGEPALGDVEGDGDVDVAILAREPGRTVVRLLINDGTGQLSPGAPRTVTRGEGPWFGDADGDGDLDVLLRGLASDFIWLHTEGGVLDPTLRPFDLDADRFVLADLDGDGVSDQVAVAASSVSGFEDLVVRSGATGQVQVIDGLPIGTQVSALKQFTNVLAARNVVVLETDAGARIYLGAAGTLQLDLAPLSPGVVRLDNVWQVGWRSTLPLVDYLYTETFAFPDPPELQFNGFLPVENGTLGFTAGFGPLTFEELDPRARLRDVDGDGDQEAIEGGVIRNFDAHLLPNAVQLSARPIIEDRGPGRAVVAFDADSDGAPDLVTLSDQGSQLRIQHNLGPGTFMASEALDGVSDFVARDLALAAGGVASAGERLAVLTEFNGAPSVEFYRRSTNRERVRFDLRVTLDAAGPPATHLAASGDIDGDGEVDVLVARGTRYDWTPRLPSASLTIGFSDVDPALGDLDGDGDLDFVGIITGEVVVTRVLSLSTFSSATAVASGFSGARDVHAADLDGDGRQDVLIRTDAEVLALRNRGAFTFDPPRVVAQLPSGEGRLDAVDLDGDGLQDVLLTPYNEGLLVGSACLVSDGAFGVRDFVPVIDKAIVGGALTVVDLDADGDPDVVALGEGADAGTVVMARNRRVGEVGDGYCSLSGFESAWNSTGVAGRMGATRPESVPPGVTRLLVSQLPAEVFCMVVASPDIGVNFPGSSGGMFPASLCLRTRIGRYDQPGELRDSGPSGFFTFDVDRNALRTPMGRAAAMAGETWYFQAWHRDVILGAPTSRFTEGLAITFE